MRKHILVIGASRDNISKKEEIYNFYILVKLSTHAVYTFLQDFSRKPFHLRITS